MKKIVLIFVLMQSFFVWSQKTTISTQDNDLRLSSLPYYNYGKGLGLTSPDSLFQLNIRFRMQNRLTYIDAEDEASQYEGQVRRLRLRFDGFIGEPSIMYAIQLSFADGDVGELQEGQNSNVIRDAVIFYRPNSNWTFLFGQTKLPGNRQRVNSSGALQLTDRTINNARFNIDRDFGFQVHYFKNHRNKFSYNIKGALSNGEGRNFTDEPDNGVALTGKIELLPFGFFEKDGANFEGDLVREQKPKLSISGAFNQNNLARRTQGQIGDLLFEKRTMKSVLLDMIFKYKGFSSMATYMSRTAKNPLTVNPLDAAESNYAFVGNGYDLQASYLLQSNYELIGRFSQQFINESIKTIYPNTNQYTIGVTKYLWEHAFKLQTELSFDTKHFYDGSTRNSLYFRFQVEIGI
uniref:porin n=2 Tax=Flavobacterium sp. TaxID=239 RepID=UPI00404975A3